MEKANSSLNIQNSKKLESWAWGLVIYTLVVIVWGAWVRISHSGDGCGDTWPLCQGVLIPEAAQNKTWIEYTHRAMSGVYGIVVFAFFIYCWRKKDHPSLRSAALATLIFTITEALLGAKLVLFGLVGANTSLYRAFVISLHQINSLLLVGSTVWLAWACVRKDLTFHSLMKLKWPALMIITIGASGAVAALASTLFPATDLLHGFNQDFSGESPALLRLRFLHPVIAISLGVFTAIKYWKMENLPSVRVAAAISFALIFGMLTLFFLSPVWMKLTHLLFAHAVWILVISYGPVLDKYKTQPHPFTE